MLKLSAVQFFSRAISREDYVTPKANLTTKEGRSIEGYLKIQFGSPLLVRAGGGTKVRPNGVWHDFTADDGGGVLDLVR